MGYNVNMYSKPYYLLLTNGLVAVSEKPPIGHEAFGTQKVTASLFVHVSPESAGGNNRWKSGCGLLTRSWQSTDI